LRIKELEEVINSKSLRLNENEVVIAQLESQVVSCSETIRALNRELGQADEHLHKLRLERPGLERKISELVA
jgi:chromosome segregation ATPase